MHVEGKLRIGLTEPLLNAAANLYLSPFGVLIQHTSKIAWASVLYVLHSFPLCIWIKVEWKWMQTIKSNKICQRYVTFTDQIQSVGFMDAVARYFPSELNAIDCDTAECDSSCRNSPLMTSHIRTTASAHVLQINNQKLLFRHAIHSFSIPG